MSTPTPEPTTTPAPAGIAPAAASGHAPGPAPVVGALAEEALLEVIQDSLAPIGRDAHWPAGTVPPGDDAAVVPAPGGAVAVSTDAMGEGTDFLALWPAGVRTRGHDVGWKAAAQNLSDINAMGGTASALVTALVLPSHTPVAWVAALGRGMAVALPALGAPGCRAAGGDLGSGDRVQVTVTVLGDPPPTGALRRRPDPAVRERLCREGADLVHAQAGLHPRAADPSGPGWAAAGLALLLTPRQVLERRWAALPAERRPGPRELARAVRAQLRPRPPLPLGPAAAAAGGVVALMDVSDGLGRDGHRIARACGDGALEPWVDEAWLARATTGLARVAALAEVQPEHLALGGGEDYGLLGVLPHGAPLPDGFRRIGRLVPAGERPAGHEPLPERGWDHFGAEGR
ncbi:thiamine-phosphate kinase [Micrococcus sp.]|uniref:thiamine-phosphate kinase n=1 Tax=Micrococcus sp. TaxID=1271 RepID=UPI002A91B3BD|nr:AIR synthase related protein [Micrococcus sp.]MDY6055676.1 AIR synthase related protein [Micrococcus sp.]